MITAKALSIITVAVRVHTAATANAVAQMLQHDSGLMLDVQVGGLGDGRGIARNVRVAVIEVDPADAGQTTALGRLISDRPDLAVVAVVALPNIDTMRRMMRLGVVDVVAQPIEPGELLAALQAAARRATGRTTPHAGAIWAFLKASGGSGATTLAVQAACAMAGRAPKARSTCLIDLDVQFGCIGLHLDHYSSQSAVDLMQAAERLDGVMLRSTVANHPGGFDIVTAPDRILPVDMPSADDARRLLEVAAEEYRHVVVDMPHTWTQWSTAVLELAETVFLVMQLSVPGIHQARRQIETLQAEGLGDRRVVPIINRYKPPFLGKDPLLRKAEEALRLPIEHFVPSDYGAVSLAINSGLPLPQLREGRRLAKRLTRMIDRVSAKDAGSQPAA